MLPTYIFDLPVPGHGSAQHINHNGYEGDDHKASHTPAHLAAGDHLGYMTILYYTLHRAAVDPDPGWKFEK